MCKVKSACGAVAALVMLAAVWAVGFHALSHVAERSYVVATSTP